MARSSKTMPLYESPFPPFGNPLSESDLQGAGITSCGFRVFTSNGLAATKWFFESGREADIVVSEIELNGANDGFALAQWVRQNRPGVRVLLTGTRERMAAQASRLCEGSETLAKPYDHTVLERRLRALARR